jgi:hypothetical protein
MLELLKTIFIIIICLKCTLEEKKGDKFRK